LGWALSAFATVLAGCDNPIRSTVRVDGSSTVFPISDAIAKQFMRREKVEISVKVPVGISGTSGGFRALCAGKTDIADASRPINAEETKSCQDNHVEFIEVPIAYDGIAVVVHPDNSWASEITTAELKQIWAPVAEKRVTRWSQARSHWPNEPLRLYGPGHDSGTFDYFAEAVVGGQKMREDYSASEDDDVIFGELAKDRDGMAFFGLAYAHKYEGKLKVLAVDDGNPDNGHGAISPSVETVRDGSYEPLSRPLFIYLNKSSLVRREVELFVEYYLARVQKFAARVGYVPLPERAYRLGLRRVADRRTGSAFGGSDSGTIEQLLSQQTRN